MLSRSDEPGNDGHEHSGPPYLRGVILSDLIDTFGLAPCDRAFARSLGLRLPGDAQSGGEELAAVLSHMGKIEMEIKELKDATQAARSQQQDRERDQRIADLEDAFARLEAEIQRCRR